MKMNWNCISLNKRNQPKSAHKHWLHPDATCAVSGDSCDSQQVTLRCIYYCYYHYYYSSRSSTTFVEKLWCHHPNADAVLLNASEDPSSPEMGSNNKAGSTGQWFRPFTTYWCKVLRIKNKNKDKFPTIYVMRMRQIARAHPKVMTFLTL